MVILIILNKLHQKHGKSAVWNAQAVALTMINLTNVLDFNSTQLSEMLVDQGNVTLLRPGVKLTIKTNQTT